MYEDFYKLTGKPFQLAPDPSFFFKSHGHSRALAYLRYGIQQGQGFIVITGDVGTGKSTLVGTLFNELDKYNLIAAKLVSTNIREHDLLRMVAAGFDLSFERSTKAALLKKLEYFFTACREEGKRVLLVVDECQNLPKKSIEELRMLSNFEYQGEPLVQSFLLGQREFRRTMRSKEFEQLRQRVIAAYHLKPLTESEVKTYIEHRLRHVGWKKDPRMDDEVYSGIYRFTRGVPRRINTLTDRLFLNASLDELHQISMQQLNTVTDEIDVEYGDPDDGQDELELEPRTSSRKSTQTKDNSEIETLAQRLSAMQTSMETMTRTLAMVNASQQQTGMPAPQPRRSLPVWGIAFAALIAAILAGGIGAFFLFR